MPRAKILIVDDEPDIRDLIKAYLEKEDFQVFEAEDGQEAVKIARTVNLDIVVLDIMLPKKSGLEVLADIRRESDVYVILLTAKTEEVDKLVGLNMGADDYLTKPFSPRELVARINASLRRLAVAGHQDRPDVYRFAHVRLDVGSHQVWVDNDEIGLTAIEFDLLRTMMAHPGQVLTREQLLDHVWGADYYGETRVIDVHVGHVRQKLSGRFISTVRGVGYRFEDERV